MLRKISHPSRVIQRNGLQLVFGLLAGILFSLVSFSNTALAAEWWPTEGRDGGQSRYVPSGPQPPFTEEWRVEGLYVEREPLVSGDLLYLQRDVEIDGMIQGVIDARNRFQGNEVKWTYDTSHDQCLRSSGIAIARGVMLVREHFCDGDNRKGYLRALDAETGQPLWREDWPTYLIAGGIYTSPPSTANGMFYLANNKGTVAVDPVTGEGADAYYPVKKQFLPPIADDAYVYGINTGNPFEFAGAPLAGGQLTIFDYHADERGRWFVSGNTVYVTNLGNHPFPGHHVTAFRRGTGEKLWQQDGAAFYAASPAVALVGKEDGGIHAYDAVTVEEIWPEPPAIGYGVTIVGNHAYLLAHPQHRVAVVSLQSGAEVASIPLFDPGGVSSSAGNHIVAAGDWLYVNDGGGLVLTGLKGASESPDWDALSLPDYLQLHELERREVVVGESLYFILTVDCTLDLATRRCTDDFQPSTLYTGNDYLPLEDPDTVRKIGMIDMAQEYQVDFFRKKRALEALKEDQDHLKALYDEYRSLFGLVKGIKTLKDAQEAIQLSAQLIDLQIEMVSAHIRVEESLTLLTGESLEVIGMLDEMKVQLEFQKSVIHERILSVEGVINVAKFVEILEEWLPRGVEFLLRKFIVDPMAVAEEELTRELDRALAEYAAAYAILEQEQYDIDDVASAEAFLAHYWYGSVYADDALIFFDKIFGNYRDVLKHMIVSEGRDWILKKMTGGASSLAHIIKPAWEAAKVVNWGLNITYAHFRGEQEAACSLSFGLSEAVSYTLKVAGNNAGYLALLQQRQACMEEAEQAAQEYLDEVNDIANDILGPFKSFFSFASDAVSDFGSYLGALLESPGELRMHDAEGRTTGIKDGMVVEEIPGSLYEPQAETAVVFNPSGDHYYTVHGTAEGVYGFTVVFSGFGRNALFHASSIPTHSVAVHRYDVDWDVLSQGDEGVTISVDQNGDGDFEQTFTSRATFAMPYLVINGNAQYATSSRVHLDLHYPVEVKKMRISSRQLSASSRLPLWQEVKPEISWLLTGMGGEQTVYVQYKEEDGTVLPTVSDTIVLDLWPPSGRVRITDPNGTYPNVVLNFSANDRGSGVADMMVSNKRDFAGASWQPYQESLPWVMEGSSVYAKFRDAAGNVSIPAFDLFVPRPAR
ncbi:MAG: PQQ-binding-like beta-propeller repeat protein [Patescibacteria group bacterium]